jgi:hypothetical protein
MTEPEIELIADLNAEDDEGLGCREHWRRIAISLDEPP